MTMSDYKNDAFRNGYDDGFSSGLLGEIKSPDPDIVKSIADPDFDQQYRQGAALGFARGRERRELVRNRAEQQIEDRER